MKPFLVNINIEPDGTVNPHKWRKIVAEDKEDSIIRLLKAFKLVKSARRPKTVFVADGDAPKHENGAPMVATEFSLVYDKS